MKRTVDNLDKIIEDLGYAYIPVEDWDEAGRRRAFANRLENGEVNGEVTADFGWEDELLEMCETPLRYHLKKEIDATNQWDATHE